MKKFLRIGALSLALLMGFSSCSNDKENTPNSDADNLSTYVGVNIAFPTADGMRGLPEDYNKLEGGEWQGRDKIEKVTIYLVNVVKDKVDYATFNKDSFEGIKEGFLKPTLAVKATAGDNVAAYAVINDINDLTASLKEVKAAQFDTQFKALEVEVTKTEEVAKYDGTYDVVMMTNATEAANVNIKDKISKEQAIAGTGNRADIKVSRVVSRAIVTIGNNRTIDVKDVNGHKMSTATVTKVEYAVGQSNKKFYNMQQRDYRTPDPVYTYVPVGNWAIKNSMFDYTDLQAPEFPQIVDVVTAESVKKALMNEAFSKFVLPVTHANETDYKKGNMTYFEITCKFTVDQVYTTASNVELGTSRAGIEGETVYLGMSDGKFYDTRANAAANSQQVTGYPGGTMKYVLWLNPNVDYNSEDKIRMSPTVRNQVYHAHISGFNEIGLPRNPLNPGEPDPDPKDPENPINPDDDPETDKTYLSASVTVLPWTIHSYKVNLGNRY